jgi:Tol biopolymer transport system component/predicted Ser/Thr protein kinase
VTGRTIAHYQMQDKLGEGGMGVVYLARDTHLDRPVAIKILPPERVADLGRKRRFVQEAKAASALNHPNIITIYDISSDQGVDFIAMEYVAGKALDQMMGRKGLPLRETLKYAVQMADALAAAHEAGIVHRDLKPGNVMVTEKGLVKVLDFGLAKLVEPFEPEGSATVTLEPAPHTEEGTIVGTVAYMSPEQAEGKKVDARSDIFSFGSVLYEMVTGRRAFQADSKLSTLTALLHREPEPIGPEAPPELHRIISRCLRKDPARRFQHMEDLKVALEELKEESDSGALAAPAAKPPVRRVSPLLLVGVAGAVALAAAAWFWFRRAPSPAPQAALTPVPLTSYSGLEDHPSFSPDGTQVAFAWRRGRDRDIYIKQIGVEEPFRLTNDPADELGPAWSPDGGYIAFTRALPNEKFAVVVVPQRGGPERVVVEFAWPPPLLRATPAAAAGLAWTPDGKSLVAAGRDNSEEPSGLFVVSVASGERRRLTSPPEAKPGDSTPAVSPDGRSVVFSRFVGDRSDLYLLRLGADGGADGEPARLPAGQSNARPAWTADGREVIFGSAGALWRMTPSTSAVPRRLALPGQPASNPAISPRGSRLAYTAGSFDTNIWRVGISGSGRESRQPAKFIASTRAELVPDYSPDGKRIAFMSQRSGAPEIWVCDSDGSHPVQLTSFGGPFANGPRWSPDGEQIVFYSDAAGNRDVYVINARGGAPRRLTDHPTRDTNPGWSRDGRWIYFSSDRGGKGQAAWKMPANGGEAIPVQGLNEAPIESADGKYLYRARDWPDKYALWRISVAGGEAVRVIDALHPTGGWALFEDGIYYVGMPGDDGRSPLQFKNLATGKVETLATTTAPPSWGFAVSPDRRTILFVQVDEGESDLMLVENFR